MFACLQPLIEGKDVKKYICEVVHVKKKEKRNIGQHCTRYPPRFFIIEGDKIPRV